MCNDKEFHEFVKQVDTLNLDDLVALCRKITDIYDNRGCGIENLNCPPMELPKTPKISNKRKSQLHRLKLEKYDTPSGQLLTHKKQKRTDWTKPTVIPNTISKTIVPMNPRDIDKSSNPQNPNPKKDNHDIKWGWVYLLDNINNKALNNVHLIARFKPLLVKNKKGETVSFCGQITEPMPDPLPNKTIHKLNYLDTLKQKLQINIQQEINNQHIYVSNEDEIKLSKSIDNLKTQIQKVEALKDSEIVQEYNQKLREWYRAIKGKEINLIEDQNLEYPIVSKIEINDGTGNFYVRCNCEEGKTVNM